MSRPEHVHPVILRPWVAVLGGAVAGIALATAVVVVWTYLAPEPPGAGRAAARPDSVIGVFRLPRGAAYEMLLHPAGPDATGEPELSAGLYPDEEPPRELASVLVANTGALGDWEVDLATEPLRARVEGGESGWVELEAIDGEAAARLRPALALRLRGLGGGGGRGIVEPGTLRRFLLALPPGRRFGDLSAVQWGERTLQPDSIDLEELHAFRERPADVAAER